MYANRRDGGLGRAGEIRGRSAERVERGLKTHNVQPVGARPSQFRRDRNGRAWFPRTRRLTFCLPMEILARDLQPQKRVRDLAL